MAQSEILELIVSREQVLAYITEHGPLSPEELMGGLWDKSPTTQALLPFHPFAPGHQSAVESLQKQVREHFAYLLWERQVVFNHETKIIVMPTTLEQAS